MALAVFNQFPQLTRFFAQLARAAARKECVREFNQLDLSTGAATMKDRAMNVAALAGGEATVTVLLLSHHSHECDWPAIFFCPIFGHGTLLFPFAVTIVEFAC